MKEMKYYAVDSSNEKHEVIVRHSIDERYSIYVDGVYKYILICLSHDAAFKEYCKHNNLKSTSQLNFTQSISKKEDSPFNTEDCFAALTMLDKLRKFEVIPPSEFETLKTKVITLYSK